jgi:precorrin-2 dehydrogenase/sirohydrochlorin ferrochelatase
MWKLQGRRVVVVGAGSVGRRKIERLLDCQADVLWVSPDAPADPPPGATVAREAYRPDHLAGAVLVLACTADRNVNARIAADARSAGALVNVADQPADCDVYLPAVWQDGDVVLAVGTGGSAPGLAGQLRDLAGGAMPDQIGAFALALAALRPRVQAALPTPSARHPVYQRLAGVQGQRAFARGGPPALAELLDALLDEPTDEPPAADR